MAAKQNKLLVPRLVEEAASHRNLDVLDEVADGEIARAARHRIGPSGDSFPDFRTEITGLIAEGEKVAVHFRCPGTHPGEWPGHPPAGRRFQDVSGVILGREPGTDHWIPPEVGRPTEQVPGVLVYLVYAPLWYGNTEYIRLRILQMLDSAAEPVHALVLDANGMSDIDYTGVRTLGELIAELKQRKVATAIAPRLIRRQLKRGGLL